MFMIESLAEIGNVLDLINVNTPPIYSEIMQF